jgi:hypothetical protein
MAHANLCYFKALLARSGEHLGVDEKAFGFGHQRGRHLAPKHLQGAIAVPHACS